MKSKFVFFGILCCILMFAYSNVSAIIIIDRSNGVLGHYKIVTEDHFEDPDIDYLACAEPGFKRCRFASLVATGGHELAEAEFDEILAFVDTEISGGNNSGGYTTLSGTFYATWTVGATENEVTIYSYQEAVDLGLI